MNIGIKTGQEIVTELYEKLNSTDSKHIYMHKKEFAGLTPLTTI
jgi:hypothetical protein